MKRSYGNGAIEPRGRNVWRLTYYIRGRRHRVTVHGARGEAQRKLRELLGSADIGTHVEPSRITLTLWLEQWITLLRRGEGGPRRRGLVSPRTSERYRELIADYILPDLGDLALQKLTATAIDRIYIKLEGRLSPTTIRHLHVALKSCLSAACRKQLLNRNPADNADPPRPVEFDGGVALDLADVNHLLVGFEGSVYLPIVTLAVMTGLRLSELLALQWRDIDWEVGTLSVERAIEVTREFGRVLKEPKSKRSKRVIVLDANLVVMLRTEYEKHLRLRAGVSDSANVSLRAIRLPVEALVFPAPAANGVFDFTKLRNGRTLTRECRAKFRKLGFAKLRFHDLRATHGTALLDRGVPPHAAAARMGHSPEVLLRLYAKHTKKADTSTAMVLEEMARHVLTGNDGGKS